MLKIPRTAALAMRYATRNEPALDPDPRPTRSRSGRAPMEWPIGSLHARQTSILRWIESRGGKVDYES